MRQAVAGSPSTASAASSGNSWRSSPWGSKSLAVIPVYAVRPAAAVRVGLGLVERSLSGSPPSGVLPRPTLKATATASRTSVRAATSAASHSQLRPGRSSRWSSSSTASMTPLPVVVIGAPVPVLLSHGQ